MKINHKIFYYIRNFNFEYFLEEMPKRSSSMPQKGHKKCKRSVQERPFNSYCRSSQYRKISQMRFNCNKESSDEDKSETSES